MPPPENGSPSPLSASTSLDRRERAKSVIRDRVPLELRLVQKVFTDPREITAVYNRLAAMPFMLDDTLRDPFIFAQSILSTVTYLLGDPPVGIIWFPYLHPGATSAIAGAIWHPSARCRWREAKTAIAVVATAHKIHRFWALTAVPNRPALRFVERLGFQPEGVLRSALCYNGQWENVTVSGMLREEIR